MKPEDWRTYQEQAAFGEANRPAPDRAASPRRPRRGLGWPMAVLLLGLGAIGGCVHAAGRLAELAGGRQAAAEPSVGVLILEEEISGSLWVTEALSRFKKDGHIKDRKSVV